MISVNKAFNLSSTSSLLTIPLSQEAYDQFLTLLQIMTNTTLSDSSDTWRICAGSGNYSSAVIYRRLIGHQHTEPVYKWCWKSYCQPKHKVFCWLLIKDRLNTRNMLRRKHMNLQTYNCEFCTNATEETLQHLFWECPFAQQYWGSLNLQTVPQGNTFDNVEALKIQLQSQFFMIVIILMAWTIWKARNEMIFNNNQMSMQQCKCFFQRQIRSVALRVKDSLSEAYEQWTQRLELTLA